MILFVISILLVITASYFITSIITPQKNIIGVIYFFLTAFAQIVLTFEILSLFNSISPISVIISNLIFFTLSFFIWYAKTRTFWKLDISDFKNKFVNSLKLDQSLIFLVIGLSILLISSLIMCIILPITNADAQAYHVARSLYWSLQGNLNYFTTADIRNLCSPINTEILYTWVLLFTKKDLFLGIFSFFGYILTIISISGILKYIGFSFRKRLWVIAILSSFASVMVQLSSTETDIIVAGLICSSIYLFWTAIRTGHKIPIFMSSLAYALAIGTKTTALIVIPGFLIVIIYLLFYFNRYKPILYLILYGIINSILFASYNYIQNFIHFGNFIGSEAFVSTCKNYYGLIGAMSNFVKYIFDLINFSGINLNQNIISEIQSYRELALYYYHLNHVPDGVYSGAVLINAMSESSVGLGPLGFILFIPCMIISISASILKNKSKKVSFLLIFTILFLINILVLAESISYMSYNIRFITSFVALSSPILIYSYTKNKIIKYAIIIIAMYYLSFMSLHLGPRPFIKLCTILKSKHSLTQLKKSYEFNGSSKLQKAIISNYKKDDNILLFLSDPDCIYLFKSLTFYGYNVEISRLEDFDKSRFNNYNVLILPIKSQTSSVITKYEYAKTNKKYRTYNNFPVFCFYIDDSLNPKKTKGVPLISNCDLSEDFLNKNYEKLLYKNYVSNDYRIYRLKEEREN